MWMIPLPDGVMSVGAVCRPDYLKQRKGRTRGVPARHAEAEPGVCGGGSNAPN